MFIMRAQFFNQGGAAMQNAYEDFLQFNRQNLIRAACAKQLTLAMTELSDIRGSQLLLTIASDKCLDALKNEDVTLEEIKRIYAGFAEFYTVHLPERPHIIANPFAHRDTSWISGNAEEVDLLRQIVRDEVPANDFTEAHMPDEGWIAIHAENAMIGLLENLTTEPCLAELHNGTYTMEDVYNRAKDWGPKAVFWLDPDLLDALEDGRITVENIRDMSCDELDEAIYENNYPNDSSLAFG